MNARAWSIPVAVIQGQLHEQGGRFVLRRADGDVPLNEPAAALLSLCDGYHDDEEVVSAFVSRHPFVSREHALQFLRIAAECGWIRH
jgi:hypothetical protein